MYSINDFIKPSIKEDKIQYKFVKKNIASYSCIPKELKSDYEYVYLTRDLVVDSYVKTNKYEVQSPKPISENFIGKYTVSVEGDHTNHGIEMYNYEINISENEISLHETDRERCSGRYRGKENNNTLELYYAQDDDERCVRIEARYTIKKEGDQFYIQGVGGERTYYEWIPLKKSQNLKTNLKATSR